VLHTLQGIALKEWKKKNKEKVTEHNRKYYSKAKERILAHMHEYYDKNSEKILTQQKTPASRIRRNACGRKRRQDIKIELFNLLGNKCSNKECLVPGGCTDQRCLQIDHVNSGGTKHIKNVKEKGYHYFSVVLEEVKKGSKEYQLMCANCNWIKRCETDKEKPGRRQNLST
jgi:hypothetical protein